MRVHFCLAVCHLFNFDGAFASLTLDDLFCSDAGLAHLGVSDDQLHELRMIGAVIEKRKICGAWLMRRVENTAVWVDLQHMNDAFGIHTIVTAGISIAAQFLEDADGLFA